jgi:hypothetical protein
MEHTERIIGSVDEYLVIEKRSHLGYPYTVWRKPMPRVNDELPWVVAYRYPSKQDALDGSKAGGTGFIVRLQTSAMFYEYVVTNRHVIEDLDARFVRFNTHIKKLEVFEGEWELSETDDLAAWELPLHRAHLHYRSIGTDWLLTKEDAECLRVGIGDDLFMVGRFINHDGKLGNIPVVRFGTIAMMPEEPIIADGKAQDSFLIEIRTIPGFSGSPVFIHMPWAERKKDRKFKPNPSERHFLESYDYLEKCLGIEWCRVKGETAKMPLINGASFDIQVTSGMSGCIPSWKILDFLATNRTFAMRREETDKKMKDESTVEYTGAHAVTQQTTPKEGDPIRIPIPSEGQFNHDLDKVIRRKKKH